jgi:SAM-dependent methyltransferase
MDPHDPAYRGQSDYTPLVLRLYDTLVLGPIARYVWHCPSTALVERYRALIREPHLDVGPGTGYFLEHSGLPAGSRVTILDPNPNVLDHASRRLRAFAVDRVQADVLKPLPIAGPYRSAALHLVLHCLPGPTERKAIAVRNVASVLEPDGVLFGASVLGRTGSHGRLARAFLAAFNRRGAFDNLDDSEASLRDMLEASFERVELSTIGSAAVFGATGRRAG